MPKTIKLIAAVSIPHEGSLSRALKGRVVTTTSEYTGIDRRRKPRSEDKLFRLVVSLNVMAWFGLVVTFVLYHYARPDQYVGLPIFAGLSVKEGWSLEYLQTMLIILQGCFAISVMCLLLRAPRNRRKGDGYGLNLFILAGITTLGIASLTK